MNNKEIPVRLFSKDKKANHVIERQFYRQKIGEERNKLSNLLHNFQSGFLEPEFEGDQTLKVTQRQIEKSVNLQTASNIFELDLSMGCYSSKYSQNGSTLLLTSSQGHTSLVNWRDKELQLEINLQDKIIDSVFLHSDQMFALSQSQGTFIYDSRGIELHRLDKSLGLQYLPYHFLLVSYDQRKLRYYDTTSGVIVADHVAKNPYTVMRQNRSNGIIALGSAKGVVQMWTPGIGTPALKIFAGAKIDDIAFYKGYMFTAADTLKVWDSRMLKVVHQMPLLRRLKSLTASQSGIIGLNYAYKMQFFKDSHISGLKLPYMKYESSKFHINNVEFVPFEDLVGLGTTKGFSCISVPGCGVPFYDTFESNPFETKKQKRESLVHKILEKLPFQTITIDPNILGGLNKISKEVLEAQEKAATDKQNRERIEKLMLKNKMKGKGKISNKINRKTIENDKIKRAELTKTINTKMWATWAEKKKKEEQMTLIQEMESQGVGVADLLSRKKTNKPIHKSRD